MTRDQAQQQLEELTQACIYRIADPRLRLVAYLSAAMLGYVISYTDEFTQSPIPPHLIHQLRNKSTELQKCLCQFQKGRD